MMELLESTLRLSTPLIFAALGGFLCERSGIATICLEGIMLFGAWTAAITTYYTHNPWMGLIAGMTIGAFVGLFHAFLTTRAKMDQIVSGVAVNLLAAGITPLLTKALFGSPTNTASIPIAERFQPLMTNPPAPFGLILSQSPLVILALIAPFLLHRIIKTSVFGLRLRASGDGPTALRTVGVRPETIRYQALFLGGALAAMGGVFLSTSHASQFTRDMTAGRGYIALAALIFGQWKVIPTFLACLLFGFGDAMQIRLQSQEIMGLAIPVQFIQIVPYALSLCVLVGFIGRDQPPLSIGKTDY